MSSEWQAASLHGIVDGKLVPKSDDVSVTEVMALDREMVGVGTSEGRKRDALARAALVCTYLICFCCLFSALPIASRPQGALPVRPVIEWQRHALHLLAV